MSDMAGKEFWDSTWDHLPPLSKYEGPVFEQHSVLLPFLSKEVGGDAIEIGCIPGNWLLYLNKEFGYRVSGIDYSDQIDYVKANLLYNEVTDFELFYTDFFQFKSCRKYNLVFSSGFVEHFEEYQLVINKHAELAKDAGLVVIMVPNLTHIHKILCGYFHPEILEVHQFPLMYRSILKDTLENAGLEVLHCEYNKTFRPVYPLPPAISYVSKIIQKLLQITHLDKIGNQFGSPYLVSISRKK